MDGVGHLSYGGIVSPCLISNTYSVCIASIARVAYSWNVGSLDASYKMRQLCWRITFLMKILGDDVPAAEISTVECCVGIISACLPTYRPLLNWSRHGHVSARSVNWPSRKKRTENEALGLSNRPRSNGGSWSSIHESINGEEQWLKLQRGE